MKTRATVNQWRGVVKKLWEFSDELNRISQDVRYCNKPSDLVRPVTELLQMTRRISVYRDQWLLKWLKGRSERLDRWPKIWERYL